MASIDLISNASAQEERLHLLNGTTGGTYYPVGVTLATLSKS
ncbi:hypothetical protein OK016_27285 [Vibrio chagasii]|nr:hypothetical protein [Vibrio chagasii]